MEWLVQNPEEKFGEVGNRLFADWMKLVDDPQPRSNPSIKTENG